MLERFADRWQLRLEQQFSATEFNQVVAATRADGTPCVLKVSRDLVETRTEIAALQLWDGHGAVKLLDADPDNAALLLERIQPGTMLVETARKDDDVATRIAGEVLRRLWRPAPADHGLRDLESWCSAFDRNRDALSKGADGFPAALFQRADTLCQELLASAREQTVLHGDLHHYNVLQSRAAGWLAIDPKGLAGDRTFDVCQFLLNPDHPMPLTTNRRRLDILCAELDLDPTRTRNWLFVVSMLNACWNYEDARDWHPEVAFAEETLSL